MDNLFLSNTGYLGAPLNCGIFPQTSPCDHEIWDEFYSKIGKNDFSH